MAHGHEEGHDRLQAEVEDGGQRERVVEPRDLGVAERQAGARGDLELGHRAVGHGAGGQRLERDPVERAAAPIHAPSIPGRPNRASAVTAMPARRITVP